MYRFDFLPAGGREGVLLPQKRLFSLFSLYLAAVLALAGAYGIFLHQLAGLKHQEAAARAELAAYRDGIAVLEKIKEKRVQKELAYRELAAFAGAAVPWSHTLSSLRAAAPEGTRLVRIELIPAASKGENGQPPRPPQMTVEGYAPSLSSVGELAAGLAGVERILAVELKEVRADAGEGAYYFKIIARIAGGEN